jgi:PhnB protein
MSTATKHIRHGVGSVRPYLYGRLDMLELVKRAFGAVELERLEAGNGYHVEAKIGDSMVVMEVGDPPHPGGTPASIYVYIDDVDAAYQRALAAGATSVAAPENKPYQERAAGIKDSFGNTWWIATYTG